MHLRIATTRGLPRLVQISTTSLIDDKIYDYMWPHPTEHPEDNVFWWYLKLEEHLYDKKAVFLVFEIDREDDEEALEKPSGPASTITYGIWERIVLQQGSQVKS